MRSSPQCRSPKSARRSSTSPTSTIRISLTFVAPKDPGIADVSARLAGKVLGAQSSTLFAQYLEENYGDAEIKLYPTQDDAYLDLASGLRPPGNEVILMIKGSAVASIVTVFDIMGVADLAFARSFDLSVYLRAAVLYVILVESLSRVWNAKRILR